tara:strand:- start:255 stop:401 length:147 start_codon:yes stop_codon:yes gene_type:complete
MHANIDSNEILEQRKIQESKNVEYSLIGLSDQSDSEMTWIKLHQMFDR